MDDTRAPWAKAGPDVPPTSKASVSASKASAGPAAPTQASSLAGETSVPINVRSDGSGYPEEDAHEAHPYPSIRKRIYSDQDLDLFLNSELFQDIWAFFMGMNDSVKNKKISDCPESSDFVLKISEILQAIGTWVTEIPPNQGPRRFGNLAFRDWRKRLDERDKEMVSSLVPNQSQTVIEELCTYLEQSFGNKTRIDYGSGHEGSFFVFLYCLKKLGYLHESDYAPLVLSVFPKYLNITRTLQTMYMLEPAGSHGVWGLDDYTFLPFLFGSSQLSDQSTKIPPKAIHQDSLVQRYESEYLYFSAIAFIKSVKKGPFFEHSPMLTDISNVPQGWPKINTGMIKMYRAEVWGKRVVIQHLAFGELLRFPE